MGLDSLGDEKFNNLTRNCSKVVHMTRTNIYCVAIATERSRKHVSRRIGSVFGFHVSKLMLMVYYRTIHTCDFVRKLSVCTTQI